MKISKGVITKGFILSGGPSTVTSKKYQTIPKEIINEEMEIPDEHYKEVGGPILYIP